MNSGRRSFSARAITAHRRFSSPSRLKKWTGTRRRGWPSAFGGGLAGMRTVCGTLSGAAMAYGLLRGYSDPQDKEAKREVYAAVHGMAAEFERLNGSIICRDLLHLDRDVKYVPPSDRSADYYQKRPCPKLCACTAGILARYLKAHP